MTRFVKNLNGTGDRRPADGGTWLGKWRAETRSARRKCAVLSCTDDDLVGAHVQEKGPGADAAWKIAPLCRSHNHRSNAEPMPIDSRVRLVYVREPPPVRNTPDWANALATLTAVNEPSPARYVPTREGLGTGAKVMLGVGVAALVAGIAYKLLSPAGRESVPLVPAS